MTSILTNTAAMSALQTLRSINDGMERTQGRVSSGLRVGAASDNAAYWSIATTMRSDNKALSTVQDALGLGAAKIDTAYAGMNTASTSSPKSRPSLLPPPNRASTRPRFRKKSPSFRSSCGRSPNPRRSAVENWIAGGVDTVTGPATVTVVSGFVRDANGSVSVKSTQYSLDATTAGGMSLLFGGDANGALDYTKGYSRHGCIDWTHCRLR